MITDCVFCQRVEKKEYDESYEFSVRFEPLNPVTPGHTLFVPKRHVRDAAEYPFIAGRVFQDASGFAFVMAQPFNLITSSGKEATQSIFHLHVHYVPRAEGDQLPLPWTGQAEREREKARREQFFREGNAIGASHDYP